MSEPNTNTTLEIKELPDGSAELPQMVETVEKASPSIEIEGEEEASLPESSSSASEVETAGHENPQDDVSTQREKIREERRNERKLKKEFKRKAEISERHLLHALKRQNEELAARLAAVENTSTAFRVAQADKSVEDQQVRVEWAKGELQKAITAGNAEAQAKLLDILTDEKARLKEYTVFKEQQIKASKTPNNHIPTEHREREVTLAKAWAAKNGWYDPANRDTDSRIAKMLDEELMQEGWNAADPEYWEELTERCRERIPHRFGTPPRSPVTANRSSNGSAQAQQVSAHLSKERVDALKEKGVWGTPEANRFIKAYIKYDKEQRNR